MVRNGLQGGSVSESMAVVTMSEALVSVAHSQTLTSSSNVLTLTKVSPLQRRGTTCPRCDVDSAGCRATLFRDDHIEQCHLVGNQGAELPQDRPRSFVLSASTSNKVFVSGLDILSFLSTAVETGVLTDRSQR